MAILNANVTTVASPIYVSSGNNAITTVHLCNYSGSSVQANIYLAPSTANVANGTTVIYGNVTIPAGSTAVSVGPITQLAPYVVTQQPGSKWTIN